MISTRMAPAPVSATITAGQAGYVADLFGDAVCRLVGSGWRCEGAIVDDVAGLAGGGRHELASRLAAIVESSDDAIIGKTLDGIITSWNPGAVRMYGYTAQEMIGHSVSRLFPPGHAGELLPILEQLRRGERVDHFETNRVRKDGTVIEVSVSVSPIRDAAGAVAGAATVARDITGRNRAAAERRAMESRLRQAERRETVGLLAGGIAHDFNNLLGAILGYAALVSAAAAADGEVRADAEKIQAMARRAGRLTRQLLIFSQRELSQPEPVDLNVVVGEVQELASASIGSSIELRLELAGQRAGGPGRPWPGGAGAA